MCDDKVELNMAAGKLIIAYMIKISRPKQCLQI